MSRLGVVKPVIITDEETIVAGHQRTRQLRNIGIRTVPVCRIGQVNIADEVTFNQIHNGADLEADVAVPPAEGVGFTDVDPEIVVGAMKQRGAAARTQLTQLLQRYGAWGAAVALASGEIVSSGQYALACRALRIPSRIYYLPPDVTRDEAVGFLRAEYGTFSYAHLPKVNWQQTFAQLTRRTEDDGTGRKRFASQLYEPIVLPDLLPTDRLVDFGSGRGAYVAMLRDLGYPVQEIEFFRRTPGADVLDTTAVHGMIERTLADWRQFGPFDRVVCDSVLNSVISQEAEEDVLACLAALARIGGTVYLAGRCREQTERAATQEVWRPRSSSQRSVTFLDEHGLSAIYRRGEWYYQKFHTRADLDRIARTFFGDADAMVRWDGSVWKMRVRVRRRPPLPRIEQAFDREFNLDWPAGVRVNRHDLARASLRYVATRWRYE